MKPTIVVIDRIHHHTELNTLRKLLSRILNEFEDGKASIFPNDIVKDFLCLIEMPNIRVGLFETDQQQMAYSLQLDFFANKSCDLIFCHCPKNAKFIEYLYTLNTGNRINLVHLENIWLDAINIDLLEDFQVDKLFEMIALKLESKSEIKLVDNEFKGFIAG